MKYTYLAICILSLAACTKKPDSPAPTAAAPSTTTTTTTTTPPPPPPPPPVTSCKGATIPVSLIGQTIPDNSSKDFVIAGFEISCGDTLTVFIRNPQSPPGQGWQQLFNIPNGASYYSVLNQTVTIHNSTGIVVEEDIEAVLK